MRADINLDLYYKTIFSPLKQTLYHNLQDKLSDNTISKKEKKTLQHIIQEEESLRNERVKLLIQIAQLKQISLPVLMKELGLNPIGNA